MTAEEIYKTAYISLDYALLRVFVKDKNKYKDLLQLHICHENNDDDIIDCVPDIEKRIKYNIPEFIEEIRFSQDKTYSNCILIMVLEGYDIMELHNWIQEIEKL